MVNENEVPVRTATVTVYGPETVGDVKARLLYKQTGELQIELVTDCFGAAFAEALLAEQVVEISGKVDLLEFGRTKFTTRKVTIEISPARISQWILTPSRGQLSLVVPGTTGGERLKAFVHDAPAYGHWKGALLGHDVTLSPGSPDPRTAAPGTLSYVCTVDCPSRVAQIDDNVLDRIYQFEALASFALTSPVRCSCIQLFSGSELVEEIYTGSVVRQPRTLAPLIPNALPRVMQFITDVLPRYNKYRVTLQLDSLLEYFWRGRTDLHLQACFIFLSVLMEAAKFQTALQFLPGEHPQVSGGLVRGFRKQGASGNTSFAELLKSTVEHFGQPVTGSAKKVFSFIDERNALFHSGQTTGHQNLLPVEEAFKQLGEEYNRLAVQATKLMFDILDYRGEFIPAVASNARPTVDNFNWDPYFSEV